MLAQDQDLVDLMYRARESESLTEVELMRVRNRMSSLITSWEYEFGEYQRGRLTAEEFNAPAKRFTVEIMPAFAPYWDEYRQFAPAQFREFMDREILGP